MYYEDDDYYQKYYKDEYGNEDEYTESEYDDNPPPKGRMLFTHGRLRPCPRCGSDNVDTFSDGTALCNACKKRYAYA